MYVGVLTATHPFGRDVMTIYISASGANGTLHDQIVFVYQAAVKQR